MEAWRSTNRKLKVETVKGEIIIWYGDGKGCNWSEWKVNEVGSGEELEPCWEETEKDLCPTGGIWVVKGWEICLRCNSWTATYQVNIFATQIIWYGTWKKLRWKMDEYSLERKRKKRWIEKGRKVLQEVKTSTFGKQRDTLITRTSTTTRTLIHRCSRANTKRTNGKN